MLNKILSHTLGIDGVLIVIASAITTGMLLNNISVCHTWLQGKIGVVINPILFAAFFLIMSAVIIIMAFIYLISSMRARAIILKIDDWKDAVPFMYLGSGITIFSILILEIYLFKVYYIQQSVSQHAWHSIAVIIICIFLTISGVLLLKDYSWGIKPGWNRGY